MRRYEVRLTPEQGWLSPFERAVREADDIELVALHRLRRLEADRGHALFEFAGEFETVRALLEGPEGPVEFGTSDVDGRIVVDAHVHLEDPVQELLGIVEACDLFLEFPVQYVGRTDVLATVLATPSAFEAAKEAIPEGVTLTLEKKRPYTPRETPFLSELTATQRRVFEAAVEMDYYGASRGATYEEIGQTVGLSGATVGEHLRKIERKLVEHVL